MTICKKDVWRVLIIAVFLEYIFWNVITFEAAGVTSAFRNATYLQQLHLFDDNNDNQPEAQKAHLWGYPQSKEICVI